MIKANFWVNNYPFYLFFETHIRPRSYGLWQHKLSNVGFEQLMNNLKALTGKSEITLSEFCGYFCIIYNETGGTFASQNEFGGPEYMFGTNDGRKRSYNHLSDLQNQKCGDQLVNMGKMSAHSAQHRAWNGTVHPQDSYSNIANEWCDFNRFRGRGINGLTGRSLYQKIVAPIVGDTTRLTASQLDQLFKRPKVYLGAFRNYIQHLDGGKAAAQLAEGSNPSAFGYLVAGQNHSYVQNIYMARYRMLYDALKSQRIVNSQFWLKEMDRVRKGLYYSLFASGAGVATYFAWKKIKKNKKRTLLIRPTK